MAEISGRAPISSLRYGKTSRYNIIENKNIYAKYA